MPWFMPHKTVLMRSTTGHMINFTKGEVVWVPDSCIQNAMAVGAQPTEPAVVLESVEVPNTPPPAPVLLTPEQKQKAFFDAFEKLLLRSARGDFTASGLPHIKQLEPMIGFPVSPPERDDYWTKYNESKQEAA